MNMLRIGQQVVCIRSTGWSTPEGVAPPPGVIIPEAKRIYTIRGAYDYGFMLGLCFEEIVNKTFPCTGYGGEPHFDAAAFRPCKTTSIEIFQKLLAPTPELVS